MMAMDDTIEVVGTHTDTMKGVAPPQDGNVGTGKKKKKKRHTPITTELPPLRQAPNVALELHQLSGMEYGVCGTEYVKLLYSNYPFVTSRYEER